MLLLNLFRYSPEGFFTYPPILENGLLHTFSELSNSYLDNLCGFCET